MTSDPAVGGADRETAVHLVRHGEVANGARVIYARLPGFGLSPLGHRMAERIGGDFAGRDVVHVAAGPLQRAQETARPLAEKFGLEILVDDRLTEAASRFEGRAVRMGPGALRDPRDWAKFRNPMRPSWGEPYAAVAARMGAAVTAALLAACGHEAVLVSHQLPIWTLRRWCQGQRLWHDPRSRECALGSTTTLRFRGGRLVGVEYRALGDV
jgi:broad specificity phosphatase PhoE